MGDEDFCSRCGINGTFVDALNNRLVLKACKCEMNQRLVTSEHCLVMRDHECR